MRVVQVRPDEAAVEETFVNRNPASTLLLGQARGVVLLAPAQAGLVVAEYPANLIKKSLVGAGHADKRQVTAMVGALLPLVTLENFGKGSFGTLYGTSQLCNAVPSLIAPVVAGKRAQAEASPCLV